ncbi:unnamed protein product [Trichobilharzia regenti]|nr:unnamed protein product [Trichobilharzia regenti]
MLKTSISVLYSHEESTIYKPIQHYPKGPHELDFYQRLFDPNCCEPALIELRQFVPDFYGLYRDSQGKRLKDVLANFKHPSLCDLKMGRRTYAPDSSPSKIMIECAKYKWREEIGFLVTGLRVSLFIFLLSFFTHHHRFPDSLYLTFCSSTYIC